MEDWMMDAMEEDDGGFDYSQERDDSQDDMFNDWMDEGRTTSGDGFAESKENEGRSSPSYKLGMKSPVKSPVGTLETLSANMAPEFADLQNIAFESKASTATANFYISDAFRYNEDPVSMVRQASQKLSTRPPESMKYATCVLPKGDMVYIEERTSEISTDTTITPKNATMLSKSMQDLMKESRDAEIIRRNTFKSLGLDDRHNEEKSSWGTTTEMSLNDPEFGMDDGFNFALSQSASSNKRSKMATASTPRECSLWVDKYTPNSFAQLLSPEAINREVLRSLKSWDGYVFRAKASAVRTEGHSQENVLASLDLEKRATQKDNGNSDIDDDDDADDDVDRSDKMRKSSTKSTTKAHKDLRPEQKVILLSGPPGTGKTTLAHIVARQCGYRPFEVNASDDRSPAALREMMDRAMTANTLSFGLEGASTAPGNRSQPNCIILDEIDGVDGSAAIDALLNIITAPLKQNQSSKSKGGSLPLTRPLICICNDHFAPCLRELKRHAELFVFQSPGEYRLVQRLKQVCAHEGVKASPTVLAELCQATGGDIRSALNTVQFTAMRTLAGQPSEASTAKGLKQARRDITSQLSSMIHAGLKNTSKDLFQIWREIFSQAELSRSLSKKSSSVDASKYNDAVENKVSARPAATIIQSMSMGSAGMSLSEQAKLAKYNRQVSLSGKALGSAATTRSASSASLAFQEITQSIDDCGESSIVMQGIFENLHRTRFNDPTLDKTSMAADWVAFADSIDYFMRVAPGGFQVEKFKCIAPAAVHLLCAQETKCKVMWPSKDRAEHYRRSQRENILRGFLECASASHRSIARSSLRVALLDVISPLVDIISPLNVRPLSFVTLSQGEKDSIMEVVSKMASTGLTYMSTSQSNTQTPYKNSNSYSNSYGGYNRSTEVLQLEPAIELLLQFNVPSADGVNQKRSWNTQQAKGFGATDEGKSTYSARHPPLLKEVKQVIRTALSNYVLAHTDTDATRSDTPETNVSSRAGIRSSSSSLASASQNVVVAQGPAGGGRQSHPATEQISDASRANKENAVQAVVGTAPIEEKPMKFGRMEGFFKTSAAPKKGMKRATEGVAGAGDAQASFGGSVIGTNKRSKPPVHFKFNQGFTNAVRRRVTLSDFL